tara:strand:- start:2652 stop:3236 length:585 start_codon:yes stop_codon:yes gene_type:complete
MSLSPKKLNLGCGFYPKNGYLNVDINENYPVDLVHNLEEFPWPFKSAYFKEISIDHLMEHLTDLRSTLSEIDRILAPNGRVTIKVPHFSRGFSHWDHKHGFDVTFPLYVENSVSGGFRGLNLLHEKTHIKWFAQRKLKREKLSRLNYYSGLILGNIIDKLANLNLFFTSKIMCFWVGGFDEIEFVFRKNEKFNN